MMSMDEVHQGDTMHFSRNTNVTGIRVLSLCRAGETAIRTYCTGNSSVYLSCTNIRVHEGNDIPLPYVVRVAV